MRAPPRPHRPLYRRPRVIVLTIAVLAAAGILVGVTVRKRLETGEWRMPNTNDFVRIMKLGKPTPSRTIFLERRPIELRPGTDDAPRGISSVLASGSNRLTRLPGWKGSEKSWRAVVSCVEKLFAPFDVTVTDQRPTNDDFVLVAVGGRPADIGIKDRRVGGLAPFSGDAIPKPVVFAFSAALRHDVRAICETIGMEVAHAYGLDHGYECKDVMTYLTGCGAKKFVDKDVRCGEKKPRICEGGAPTQNSYQHLVRVLGARK